MVPFIQTDVAAAPRLRRPAADAAGQLVRMDSRIQEISRLHGTLVRDSGGRVAKVADQLKTNGEAEHGRLGISIQGLDETLTQSFGLTDSNGAASTRSRRTARPRRRLQVGRRDPKIDGAR